MEQKFKNLVLFVIGFVLLFGTAALGRRLDPNIYYGPDNRSDPPNLGDPNWVVAPNSVVPIDANKTISIGIDNIYAADYIKAVTISLSGDGVGGSVSITGAAGYDPNRNSADAREEFRSTELNKVAYSFVFNPQPAYKIFRVKNSNKYDSYNVKVKIIRYCEYSEDSEERIRDGQERKHIAYGAFERGGDGTVEITAVCVFHEAKTADINETAVFVPPEELDPCNPPTGTWTTEYITADPNTGEPLPQGGWMFYCEEYDRGIWEDEEFGYEMATTTLAGGNYWVLAYDRQRDEWLRVLTPDEEIEYIRGDLNWDGMVDFKDFALFTEQWLEVAPVYEYEPYE